MAEHECLITKAFKNENVTKMSHQERQQKPLLKSTNLSSTDGGKNDRRREEEEEEKVEEEEEGNQIVKFVQYVHANKAEKHESQSSLSVCICLSVQLYYIRT